MSPSSVRVLVVEDGNEYITNLTTFVAEGFVYEQAQSGDVACRLATTRSYDVIYLDMRFDRTPAEALLGDIVQLTARFNGDIARARRFQEDNQGLFILRALRSAGYRGPVVLSYDFSLEERRFAAIRKGDGNVHYCPDYADAATIRRTLLAVVGLSPGTETG